MVIHVLDMFCGAGGSSAGARLAGAKVVHAIDAWDLAAQTFEDNFPDATVEIRELTPSSRLSKGLGKGDIDLILASPECTNHSPAKGAKPRCEDSRGTSHYVVKYAKKLRPRWIVLENVLQLRAWHGYDPLISELQSFGYKIRPQILDAADFGVPQTRRRLFILCDREREPDAIQATVLKRRSASEVIRLDGPWLSKPLRLPTRAKPTLERAERAIEALGVGVPFLIVYYGSDGAGGWQSLDRPLRTLTTLDRFGLVTWRGKEPFLRMLQVEELRSAMGFPTTYRIDRGSRRDRIKMLGNGVAPPVMKAIIESLSKPRHDFKRLETRRQLGSMIGSDQPPFSIPDFC
jgi:DNA (cytosine-5)-methyltransferase 1